MRIEQIDRAEAEAKRFLERGAELRKKHARDIQKGYPVAGTSQSGAVRRASMDLTRALADLRSYAR